jgi:hypothetical protein
MTQNIAQLIATAPHPRGRKIAEKQLSLRATLWPNLAADDVWSRKKGDAYNPGFTTIPKTLPLILTIIDALSPKGNPASAVYFDLWCRIFDEGFVTMAGKHGEMAFSSGYAGQRAVQTWARRMDVLDDLGFILIKPGPNSPKGYALVVNPYKVLKLLRTKRRIIDEYWFALAARANEVGATELLS